MPIFEYRCEDCGKTFEFYQRGKDTPQCPVCGSKSLSKMLSRFSAHVKGGNGSETSVAAGSGSCAGCAGGSCATCGK